MVAESDTPNIRVPACEDLSAHAQLKPGPSARLSCMRIISTTHIICRLMLHATSMSNDKRLEMAKNLLDISESVKNAAAGLLEEKPEARSSASVGESSAVAIIIPSSYP